MHALDIYRCTRYLYTVPSLLCVIRDYTTSATKRMKSQHKYKPLPMCERLSLILNTFFCFSQLEVEISELREKASKQTSIKTDDTALR